MKTKQSQEILDVLLREYSFPLFLTKQEVAPNLVIRPGTINSRIKKGIDIPCYYKFGPQANSAIRFSIFDLAHHIASDTVGILTKEERREYILEYLNSKYQITLSRKDMAQEIRTVPNTISKYVIENAAPEPIRQNTKAKNIKMFWTVVDIAEFYSNVIETM